MKKEIEKLKSKGIYLLMENKKLNELLREDSELVCSFMT